MLRRIGCRAHDYGKQRINDLSKLMSEDGYDTTQLAIKKAMAEVEDLELSLNPYVAQYIREAMERHEMDISVLGAYLNYAHPVDAIREQNITIMQKHLLVAKEMGARMVGTETGSLHPEYKPHADNHGEEAFLRFEDAVLQVLDYAEQGDSFLGVEPLAHHIIHTPKRLYRLFQEVNHSRLKVIFDISNLLTPDNVAQQDEIIREMFDLLGDKIGTVHAKDFTFVNGEKRILPLGQGQLNLALLMERVKGSAAAIDVLAENVSTDYLDKAAGVIRDYAK